MLLLSLNLLTFPFEMTGPAMVGIYGLLAVLAAAALVLPLQVVRRRLVAEKRLLMADLDRRLEATSGLLNRALDEAEMGEMEPLNHRLEALNAQRSALERIPTLPWRGATLRGFVSAIALPVALFVLQTIIGRWLGRWGLTEGRRSAGGDLNPHELSAAITPLADPKSGEVS